jgi:hypothetical protein
MRWQVLPRKREARAVLETLRTRTRIIRDLTYLWQEHVMQPSWRSTVLASVVTATLASGAFAQEAALPGGVRQIPITGPAGWAKTSVNTVIFRYFPIATKGDTQYAAYYDDNAHVVLATRKLSDTTWQTKVTDLTGNARDAHNTISLAIDGDGILHLSWDHHGNNLNYVRTVGPDSLELTPRQKMDGIRENALTYPQFFTLPDGDLLFFYRVGSSGNGDLVLKRYAHATKTWSTRQQNLITGEGKANAYPEFCVGPDGTFHLGWTWRSTPDVATNHNVCYTRSKDGGKTWTDSKGNVVEMPIKASTGEVALEIPQKSDLMNQTTIAADAQGRPFIATYFRPKGQTVPQIMIVYHDGREWRTSQVGTRTGAFSLSGGGTRRIPLSRPLILADSNGGVGGGEGMPRVMVIFRDADRQERVSLAVSSDIASNQWTFTDLTTEAYGYWEPSIDMSRWQQDHVINLFLQKTDQPAGDNNVSNVPPTPVSILEYKP